MKPQLVPELTCQDAAASKKFYTETLGFSIFYERPEIGFYYLRREGIEIMLEQHSNDSWISGEMERPYGRGINFQIMTTGIDKLLENCKTIEAKIFLDMEEVWYRADVIYFGQKQFIVCDPDGYLLRICEKIGEQTSLPKTGRVVS